MQTYELRTIFETTIINENIMTTSYTIPVDLNGVTPEYLSKNRVIKDNNMLVFDDLQEYSDWLANNV